MNKVGRPKRGKSRKHDLHVRLSDSELEELITCSENIGVSKSEIIRNSIRMCCNLAYHNAKKD